MNSNLLKKLKIEKGMVGKLLNTPSEFVEFEQFLEEYGFLTTTSEAYFTLCFVTTPKDVDDAIPFVYDLQFDGILWMIYPKKGSSIQSAIGRKIGWEALHDIGYKETTAASINDSWSALRFRSVSLIKSSKKKLGTVYKVANHSSNRANPNIR